MAICPSVDVIVSLIVGVSFVPALSFATLLRTAHVVVTVAPDGGRMGPVPSDVPVSVMKYSYLEIPPDGLDCDPSNVH